MTAPQADHRVLFIDTKFFKYGTHDKGHAAALIFSFLLLAILAVLIFVGMNNPKSTWDSHAFNWLGSTFLVVIGVAIGKGSAPSRKDEDQE